MPNRSLHPPTAALLPLAFEPLGLQEDLLRLGGDEWTAHFNTGYYDGNWSGAALRAAQSSASAMHANASQDDFANTKLFQECSHLRAVVEAFQCPLRTVRLLRLTAGSNIREHRDYDLGYAAGEVRIHVPVITNPDVEFYLDGKRIRMAEGECWYLDLNLPHRVQNRGSTDRVHLVIDCQLNEWLRDLISKGKPCRGTESGFELFRAFVLANPEIQDKLRMVKDRQAIIELITELGREHGFDFLSGDVDGALQSARSTWMKRWTV